MVCVKAYTVWCVMCVHRRMAFSFARVCVLCVLGTCTVLFIVFVSSEFFIWFCFGFGLVAYMHVLSS